MRDAFQPRLVQLNHLGQPIDESENLPLPPVEISWTRDKRCTATFPLIAMRPRVVYGWRANIECSCARLFVFGAPVSVLGPQRARKT